jgi:tripartite-type tricarboxylate transporter receptor subunit TctC
MLANTILAFFAMALGLAAMPAAAQSPQDYPSKPVTFIIPFTPGSSTEVEARVYTQGLTGNLNRQFIIDFKPGAGSTVGTNYVAKAAPDGYTLLFFTSSFSTAAALYKNLPYDSIRDFAPVSLLSKRPMVLIVNPNLPFRSAREYLDHVRQNPGKVNVVTAGAGSASHFAAAWLHKLSDTQVTFVHYKGGAPMFVDLIAGRAQATVTTLESALPHIKSGRMRPLGISFTQAVPILADVPPIADQAVKGYEYAGELGVLAPRATPPAIVNKLSGELAKVAKGREAAARLEGSLMIGSTPEELGQHLVINIKRLQELTRDSDISPDN